jgi:phosphohistidine phosphatase SixA
MSRRFIGGLAIGTVVLGFSLAVAQPGSQDSLINELREGGLVLLMRHASSPRDVPSKANANPDNTRLERQLDESGRRAAIAMGTALRRLRIPIGTVLSSPTYRALETVRLARLDNPAAVNELGDGGHSMQGITEAQAAWLRSQASDVPKTGNTILVTHLPNLTRAFPDWGSTVADGETVVLRPDGHGKSAIVGRIPIERWPEWASALGADQHGELAGIRGLPVEGHDTVAAIEIVGTNKLSGFQNMRERFRSNGAELRLGLPLESQTLCRFREVLRDLLREKGYPDAEIAVDSRPTYGNRGDVTLLFTVTEGKRSRRTAALAATPAERCLR